jgi:surfactin synthase thioesterase subunit
VEPVELPGRGSRIHEKMLRNFAELANDLTSEIAKTLTGDYALFGHSLGGLLAYECSHRLIEKRLPPPAALVVACSPAPTRRSFERFENMNTDEDLIKELRSHNGTPEEIFENPEMLRFTLDVLAADFAACATFDRKERLPLRFPIHVYGGLQDDVEKIDLEAWSVETKNVMTLDMFEGGHFFFRDQETFFMSFLERVLADTYQTAKG